VSAIIPQPLKQKSLLEVKDLKTWFSSQGELIKAVDGVSFNIERGKTFALLGESGCGKSVTSLSLMRLIPEPGGKIVSGSVSLDGLDIMDIPELQMRDIRGKRIAMIFQEPMTSLNPVLTVGTQIGETLTRHKKLGKKSVKSRVLELLDGVGISDPPSRYHEYPHQLSGGMKQRVMIAIALAGEPELLIADEPTTALDVTIQAQVLELLKKIQAETGMAIMLITHDLGVVAEMADHVAVMYAGQIVERADRHQFFTNPQHPYSKKLFDSIPNKAKRGQELDVIKGFVPSMASKFEACRFEPRCDLSFEQCRKTEPQWQQQENNFGVRCFLYEPQFAHLKKQPTKKSKAKSPKTKSPKTKDRSLLGEPMLDEALVEELRSTQDVLTVDNLKVHFPIKKGILQRNVGYVMAVDGVSMTIPVSHTLALVGESGCGKTTVGKGITQLIRPTSGSVMLGDNNLTKLSFQRLKKFRKEIQIIFQDPFSSMNPRMLVGDIIEEGMIAQRIEKDTVKRKKKVDDLLEQVGLSSDAKSRYPHEFSGGQRQRICIARSLAVNPKIIICDEPTSALDVSVQAQILNLLQDLQKQMGLSYLFISHDLSVVEYLAHEIAVMYLGRIVEFGSADEVLSNPLHPYTQALLSAIPNMDGGSSRKVIRLGGELPSPANPPRGCHFHPRCAKATQECKLSYPDNYLIGDTHSTRCFLYQPKDAN